MYKLRLGFNLCKNNIFVFTQICIVLCVYMVPAKDIIYSLHFRLLYPCLCQALLFERLSRSFFSDVYQIQ